MKLFPKHVGNGEMGKLMILLEYTVGNCKKVLYMVILVVVNHGKPNQNIMKQ